MTLLDSHFERIKRRLEAEGNAAKSFHHGLNRGLIREAFIREFLAQHISDLWGVGTGEIIHKDANPEDPRPQIDVIVHNKRYPKLPLAAGIDLFFVESVSSFIEIKSKLKKEDLRKIVATTKKIKNLADFAPQKLNPTGIVNAPRPYSFVFAYDGPSRIKIVNNWLKEISQESDYGLEALSETAPENRSFFKHQFIDAIFVLGKGFVVVDALPFESWIARAVQRGENALSSSISYYGEKQELILLWALVNQVNVKLSWGEEDLNRYIGAIRFMLEDEDDEV